MINSLSRSSTSITPPAMTDTDKEIRNLMQQKSKIMEQIQDVKANDKLDTKTKSARIKTLTENMQQIDAEILQKKAEEQEEKNKNKQQSSTAEQESSRPSELTDPVSSQQLLTNGLQYNQLGKLVGMRNQANHTIQTIEGELQNGRLLYENTADPDGAKSVMLANAERTVFQKKRESIQDVKVTVHRIEGKMNDILQDIHDTQKKAGVTNSPANINSQTDTNDSPETGNPDPNDEITDPEQRDTRSHKTSTKTSIDIRV
ncbi:FlxA-like family protein [Paenibacillus lacisoli]|nr:FlxA-like family protein [Paenibacillus sp. JX-17]